MRIPRIFTGQSLRPGTRVELEASASQHVARALRMQVGDALVLFDGTGGEYAAHVEALNKKTVSVEIGDYREHETESPLAIHLGIAV
jgi:16S rRNA (uracil1498-N3)-methyltransferase